jgi:hypothetical protein
MLRIATSLCVLMIATGCDRKAALDPNADVCTITGPKLRVPAFNIRIVLSDTAAEKLRIAGESIKGFINFDGDGIPKKNEYTAPNRPVVLGCYEFEIKEAGDVSVADAHISAEAAKRLTDLDYYVTISVFSARRAFKDNVLKDGVAAMRISQATKSPIQISCDLLP